MDGDLALLGIKPEWKEQHWMTGLAAHWNKNANAAAAFDQWFLNLFPRATEFVFEHGGYATLNFVPSMATMLLGLMAGELLHGERSKKYKFIALCLAGSSASLSASSSTPPSVRASSASGRPRGRSSAPAGPS